ncbi:hypothetical protein ACYJW8_08260 [Frateuria aurantia]
MMAFTPRIDQVIAEYHVMSLASSAGGELWAAPLFYVFDATEMRLIFVTEPGSCHGRLLLADDRAVVTISGQLHDVAQLRGLQMRGTARPVQVHTEDHIQVDRLYRWHFPIPAHLTPCYWAFSPGHIKLTDNRVRFGFKEYWDR